MDLIGWLGVCIGVVVPLPQLYNIFRHNKINGVSMGTYSLLVMAMACYLVHAINIGDAVFVVAQSINILTNGLVLFMLIKNRNDRSRQS
jgi:MtN3 and saliva related transmembrane protein